MATSRTTDTSSVSYTLPDGVDDLILTGSDDIYGTGNALDNQITGNVGKNILQGLAGSDTLLGGDGNDTLDGGTGSDTMIGGLGDDAYIVDDYYDSVIEQGATVQSTLRISTDSTNKEANAESYGHAFSADGTKVLLTSIASNLVLGDNNDVADVFIKDLITGEVTRVSTNASGEEVSGDSYAVGFSADGTKVLFSSIASTLVDNDNNQKRDVFIKDLKTGEVTLVSNGTLEGFNGDSEGMAISADGTKVLFNSDASNIVAGDTNNSTDAFIKDLTTGEIIRVSTDSGDKEARIGGFAVGISADGSKVLFESSSADLVANDTNSKADIFIKDINTGEVTRISTDLEGVEANGNSEAYAISADGTKVLFASDADNLVLNDTNGSYDVFIKDLTTGEVTRVSTNGSFEGNGASYGGAFSADGTKVLFTSESTNFIDGDTNRSPDVFVKDLKTGAIISLSTDATGSVANGSSEETALSADGTKALFVSTATNLVSDDTNDVSDIFLSTISFSGGNDSVQSSVSYYLPNNVENLTLLGSDSLSGSGNDLANMITGSAGGDYLYGYGGNDTISGLAGNDYIDGGAGDDVLAGNQGDDYLVGGDGNNTYIYTEGHDIINNSEDYYSTEQDFGIGDTLNLSNLTRQQVAFTQDIQNATTLIIRSLNNVNDTVRIDNFFMSLSPDVPSLRPSNDAIEKIIFSDGTTLTATQVAAIIGNTAPQLTVDPFIVTTNEDSSITLSLLSNATDADGQTLSLANVKLLDPSQGTLAFLDSQQVVFTPSPDFNGAVQLSYSVSDGIESVTGQAIINVAAVNDAPRTVSPLINRFVDEAKAFSYVLPVDAFVDVDGDVLSYNATLADDSPLPAWLSFNDKTQTFSGTPSFNDSDMLNVKVTASDGKLVTTQVFVLDVKNVNQTPVAVLNAPLLVTDEDVDVNIDLLARVTDPDNDVVMLQSLGANNGGLTLNADQTVTYTPFANFNGIDTITYTVKDELGATFTRTEQITINAVNDAPQLLSTPAILNDGTEDTAYTINTTDLLQGFVDVDGDSLSVANLYVTEGQIVSNQDGTFTFNPSPNFFGTVSLGYQVSDGNGGLVDISNTLTLASVNDAPVAPSAPISITNGIEDVAYTMTTTQLLAGFSDVDGDVLSVVGLTSDSGFLQDNADGTYTLTPNANFNGNITLNYQVSDGKGGVVDASNSFVVDAVNDAPELLSTPAILNNGTEDTAYTIQASDLLQGFSDVDGDTLSVINLSSSSGFLQDNQDGTYTLTPNTNFNGLIQLDYQVDDGNGGVVDASNSVFIQAVNDAPVAPSSPISLASGLEDTAYTIQASDLLQGFSDIDSPSLSVVNLTSSSGFLQDNQDGTYTFSPNSNFNGTVQLTYQVTDNNGGVVNAANSFVVAAVNDAPTILESLLPRTSTETQNFSYTVPASIFTDIDGDVLTYTASLADNSSLPSWLSFDAVTRTFSGTPSLTDAGVLSIKVIANDGQLSANQVFTLTVNDFVVVNHPPELLSTPAILNNGTEDTAYTIQASDLLQGFSDVDGDTLSVINLSSSSGFLQDNQDGTYTFSPNPNFNGTVQLTYQVTDNNGGVVDASNSVFITPVNDLPVAPSSPISLTAGTEDTAYTIQASDLLQGFSDVDGDTLSVINLSSSSGVLQDNADGTYTLTPNANFNGSIGLTYQVSDGTDTTDASRSVFIQAVNDAPIASSSPISLTAGTEDTAYTIQASDLLQGFSDIDSPSLSVVNLTSSSGFLQDNQDGTYTLTPTKDFNGSIGLTYQVSDGTDTTDASSSVFIQAVNDAPVAPSNPISLTAGTEDTAYIIQASDLLQGFSDVEGDSLSAVNLTSSSGFLQDNQDGTYTLTPNTNFNGLIQLDYQVDDSNGGVVDATSSVFITAVNDAPVAPSNPISLTAGTEDTAYTIQASDLLQGFSDIDSPSLSVINLSSSSGLLQDNQDGTYTLTPTKDFNGSIGLTYQVSDGTDTPDASRSVFIQAVNDAPIAPSNPISLTAGTEDTAYTIQASDLLQGFSDVEGDSLSVINLSSSSGFLQDNQDGTYTFSPNSNFNGTVQLTYQVTDNNGGVVDASNSVFIQAVNDAPAILEALLPRTATETQAFSLTVPQSAFGDIDGDVLTYTASLADNSSLPSWLSFDAVTRTFSGTPSLTDAGVLSIKVIANDGQLSANQVFTLTVNDFVVVNHPPELLSTPAILNNGTEDTAYTIQASDLLQGFSDVDGDTLSVINLSSSSGFLQDNQDGTYTLTPNTNFNGLIQLDYQVDDGNGGVVDASNSVFIQAVNDAPVAPSSPISLASGLEDTAYTIQASDLLQGFSDIDSPSLSVVNLTSSSGFLQDNQDGTYTLTPTKDFNGSIGLTYQVSDGTDTTDASRSVFIQAVNDAPIAPSSPISLTAGTEDTAYTINASELLQGFSDIDGDTLSVVNLSSSSGLLQDNQDGTYTFSPNSNFNGTVQLTYQVTDNNGGVVDASNSVFIQAVNDAPAILEALLPRTATETQAFSLTVPQSAFGDIDGDVLTYTASLADNSSLPSWLSFDAVTRTFSGTPSLTDAGVLSIKVIANDGQLSANQVFTLTVNDFVVVNHPPELLSTPAILNNGTEDTAYTIQASDLLQGFSDVDGDTLSVINLSSSSGFLQDNQDGTYTLTPNTNFNGLIQLDYQVDDGNGGVVDASNSVFIQAVNDAPVAPSSPISLASGLEDTAYTIQASDLLQGFSDIDSPSLSVVNLTSSSGFLQDNQDGTYTLTPTKDFNGSIGLTYQVSDGTDTTDASRSVFIQAVNDTPIAPSSPISLASGTEDTAYTINSTDLLQGFSDIDGDTLSVVNLSSSSGFLQDNADGAYTLTPTKDFNGSIGLTYQVSDGTDTTDASRSVFIQAVNDAPIAPSSPISLTAGTEDTAYTIQASDLLQGFSDIDSPSLSVINLSSSSGVLQDNADGTYTLTPNKDFNGSIGLTYQVSDGTDTTDASRSVFIQAVNDAPIAPSSPISLTAGTEDTAYTIQASDLLQGFSDVDGDSLSVINLSSNSGLLQDNQDGTYTLTPNKDFNGSIGLTYQVSDGTDTTDASRSVFIQAVNDAPIAPSSPISLTAGTEDTAYTINASDLLQGFSDIDSPSLSVINLSSSSGFLQDNADGTYTLTPTKDFNGSIGLTYQVSDGTDTTDASRSVFIQAVNDAPVAPSSPISLTAGTEDTAYTIKAADLLNGFSDIDGDTLSVVNLTSSSGLLQDNADGTYTFSPNPNFNGTVQLTYQVTDNNGGVVDASNSVFIQAVNDAPAILEALLPRTATETQAFSLTVPQSAFGDIDGDVLTYTASLADNSSLPSWLSFDAVTRTFSGTPSLTDAGVLSIKVIANDGQLSANQVFTLTVNDFVVVNHPPELLSTPAILNNGTEDTAYTIQASDLLQGFSDVEGDSLSVINLSSSSGFLQDNADGTYTLTPTKDFNGSIGLTYQVSDGTDTTDASSSVFITAVNDAPVAPSSPISLTAGTEDTAYTINASDLLQGFSDIDSPSLSVINLTSSSGFLQDNADGTYTLTPTKDFNGSIGLTYQVSDGTDTTDASRSVFIQAVNDAPIAPSSPISLTAGTEDTAYTINASDLLQGFSDIDGDTLSVVNLSSSSGLLQDNADGTYTLTPTKDFNGSIGLTYQVSDGTDTTDASRSVFIQAVNDAPIAPSSPISLTAGTEDTAYTINASDLLQGFSDIDSPSLSVVNLTSSSGFLQDNADGTYTLTPTKDFNGSIGLTYQVSDGTDTTDASRSVFIQAVNDTPIAPSSPISLASGTEDTAYTIKAADLLNGFSDIDGDTLSVVNLTSSSGFLQDNADGTYTLTPNANFNGSIGLTYQVSDGTDTTDASRSVFIQAVNDAPIAPSSPISLTAGTEDTAYTINASDLLQGFSDIDSPSLSVVNLTSSSGFLQDNQDGTYTLTPTKDFNGSIGLTYQVSDGTDTTDASRSVFIQAVNDTPIAPSSPISLASGTEDTAYTIKAADLLNGFSDIDGDTLSVINLSSNSGLLQDNQDGTYTLTPTKDFNGSIGLTYQVSDGTDTTDASRSVFITAVNDAPTITLDPLVRQLPEDSRIEVDVLANVTDIDSTTLTLVSATADAAQGQVNITSDQKLFFTPNANFNGEANLSYTVKDEQGATVTGTLKLNVTPVNDAPVLRVTKPTNNLRLVEDATAVLVGLAFGLQVEDVDAQPLSSLTIAIQQGSANDVLSLQTQGTALQATFDAQAGIITITGLDSIANYQKVLDSLAISTSAEQGALERGLKITINDGQLTDMVTLTLPVDYVQDESQIGGIGNDTLNGSNGNDLLIGGDGDDILNGGNGNDTLNGGNGNDILNGGDGQDTMDGGDGDDIFIVDDAGDVITDTSGIDQVQTIISFTLPEGFENLQFTGLQSGLLGQGNSGNNTMQNNDTGGELQGGAGNDRFEDGAGRDVFVGGQGADTFDFSQLQNGVLRLGEVLDFSTARGDKIDVSKIDANSLEIGNQSFSFVGEQDFSGVAGELRFSQRLLQGDINGDGQADFEIKLVGVLELKQDDILL